MNRNAIPRSAVFALAATLLWTPGAGAATDTDGVRVVSVARIANDHDPSVSTLGLVVGPKDRVEGISIVTYHPAGESPAHTVRRRFTLQKVGSPRGVVVTRKHGREVIALRGRIDPATGTGALVIRYLSNGLFGSHEECGVRLVREPDGWRLAEPGGKVIRDLYVKTWFLGVSTIDPICGHG